MVKLQHIQQINDGYNWKCGAVCLEMIFNHYGIKCDQDAIWEAIKCQRGDFDEQFYAMTCNLARYAISQGLNATIYKSNVESWKSLLEHVDTLNLPLILSVKEEASGKSHFVVYLGKNKTKHHIADPNTSKSVSVCTVWDMQEMWSPHPEINVTGFIYIVFEGKAFERECPICKYKMPMLTCNGVPYSPLVGCPYCDTITPC